MPDNQPVEPFTFAKVDLKKGYNGPPPSTGVVPDTALTNGPPLHPSAIQAGASGIPPQNVVKPDLPPPPPPPKKE